MLGYLQLEKECSQKHMTKYILNGKLINKNNFSIRKYLLNEKYLQKK